MIRGIERQNIFKNDKDREDFLNGLSILLPETRTCCYGWVLIPNIAERVAKICEIETDDIFLKGKQQKRVKARRLFCYWAVRELGVSLTELARRLHISVPGVGYSVDRGESIARKNDYRLIE